MTLKLDPTAWLYTNGQRERPREYRVDGWPRGRREIVDMSGHWAISIDGGAPVGSYATAEAALQHLKDELA